MNEIYLKIRNKQINKVKLQERKKNISIKQNIVIKEELKNIKKLINILKKKEKWF